MHEHFTKDWSKLHEKACEIVNASLSNDKEMHRLHTNQMMELLDELENRYGPSAIISDTRGDYSEDYSASLKHYIEALDLAVVEGNTEMIEEVKQSIVDLTIDNEE